MREDMGAGVAATGERGISVAGLLEDGGNLRVVGMAGGGWNRRGVLLRGQPRNEMARGAPRR